MRYPSVEGAPNVYIEGSYRGHKASPGAYTAILKYGSEEKTTTFSILPNPGIQATAAEYQESHEFQSKVEAAITEIHRAVNQLKEAKRQTEDLIKVLDTDASRKEIKDAAEALVTKITTWDEKVVQRKSESNDDIINFVNKISADYIFLKGELDSNTPMVSQGAREQLDALNGLWKTYKAEYEEIVQKDVVNLNTLCRQKGVDKVSLPTSK
jgi:ribonuclease HI